MNNSGSHKRLILAVTHLVLGVLVLSGLVVKAYSILIVFFGVLYIIRNKNENNEAIYWSAYLVGAEVLFRMAGGMIFYELPKYAVLLFLFVGLVVEKRSHSISLSYFIYILLLLIGIAFVDIPFSESIRKAVAFNLSGPILLGVSAIYFYRRPLTLSTMMDMLFYMLLPIISTMALLYFKTPDISEISFGGDANFAASCICALVGWASIRVPNAFGQWGCTILVGPPQRELKIGSRQSSGKAAVFVHVGKISHAPLAKLERRTGWARKPIP